MPIQRRIIRCETDRHFVGPAAERPGRQEDVLIPHLRLQDFPVDGKARDGLCAGTEIEQQGAASLEVEGKGDSPFAGCIQGVWNLEGEGIGKPGNAFCTRLGEGLAHARLPVGRERTGRQEGGQEDAAGFPHGDYFSMWSTQGSVTSAAVKKLSTV